MNVQAFQHLYAYHFAENRALWENSILALSEEQFTQPVAYSLGSIQNHILHLVNVDNGWFSDLLGLNPSEVSGLTDVTDRAFIRTHWDHVEQKMRGYLDSLNDAKLAERPLHGEDQSLTVWQVLLHVVNHGTDHRAQILRLVHDLGHKTGPQD
jgi:uncharacterized damage-inducible protein DinB